MKWLVAVGNAETPVDPNSGRAAAAAVAVATVTAAASTFLAPVIMLEAIGQWSTSRSEEKFVGTWFVRAEGPHNFWALSGHREVTLTIKDYSPVAINEGSAGTEEKVLFIISQA
jgi:hypothetical protein